MQKTILLRPLSFKNNKKVLNNGSCHKRSAYEKCLFENPNFLALYVNLRIDRSERFDESLSYPKIGGTGRKDVYLKGDCVSTVFNGT
jgi:hypothetical protein